MTRSTLDEFVTELSKQLADQGKLIEAGWVGLRAHWIAPDAPAHQVRELRQAFMAGAVHLFATINQIMDPGDEPTPADLARMDKIAAELKAFEVELAASVRTPPFDKLATAADPWRGAGPAAEAARLGDAPIEAGLRNMMNTLAHALDDMFNGDKRPRQTGFVLMAFPFAGFDGRCNYISNAARADIVTLFKEQLARFEGQPETKGTA